MLKRAVLFAVMFVLADLQRSQLIHSIPKKVSGLLLCSPLSKNYVKARRKIMNNPKGWSVDEYEGRTGEPY